jgi:crotonobetaine/carnitine-CoA ligase
MPPDHDVLPNLLAQRAIDGPDRIFVHNVGGEDLSYGRLEALTSGWMRLLAEQGVAAGDRVVMMLPNTEVLPVWMAIARLGAIEVPVNNAYRGSFLEHMLVSSGARCAVIAPEYGERFAALGGALGDCHTVVISGGDAIAVQGADVQSAPGDLAERPYAGGAERRCAAHDPAAILYTSGTTGASKGAVVSWQQMYRTAEACPPWHDLGPEDVRYSPFPMFHMSGKLAAYSAAVLDGRIVIRNGFSTSQFWADIDRYGCTTSLLIGATPTFIAKLPPSERDRRHTLRNVLLGPPPEDPVEFCRRFNLRASVVFNMTELSCPTSTGWDEELLRRGSVGVLRPGYAMRIVDDNDYEVAPGTVGEIVVRSEDPWQIMGGYWGMPEKTVEVWRNLWFHSGDLGRMDADGTFYFLDRKKDAIRRRGENISSMELEAEICEADSVVEAAVVGVPSDVGEEDVRAVVVPRDPETFDPAGLIDFLRDRVPAFMLPRYVTVAEALPKTPTEKVRKTELKSWPLDQATWEYVAPQRSRGPAGAPSR